MLFREGPRSTCVPRTREAGFGWLELIFHLTQPKRCETAEMRLSCRHLWGQGGCCDYINIYRIPQIENGEPLTSTHTSLVFLLLTVMLSWLPCSYGLERGGAKTNPFSPMLLWSADFSQQQEMELIQGPRMLHRESDPLTVEGLQSVKCLGAGDSPLCPLPGRQFTKKWPYTHHTGCQFHGTLA